MVNISNSKLECPYGADDCPKTSKLEQMLKENADQLAVLTADVNKLNTTMKNASYILMIIVTILGGLLGAVIF